MKTKEMSFRQLVTLFTFTYFISYVTRINFGAVISEMVSATGMTKSVLSTAVTGSFITYGIGQIISGILGDKLDCKKLIGWGLAVTTLMNLLIPFCTASWQMTALWCVNGAAQAFMWPPLVKIMTVLFDPEDYKKATVNVIWGSSYGTIAVYLVSPILIALSGWKAVFIFCGLCGAVMLLIWCRSKFTVERPKLSGDTPKGSYRFLYSPLMIGLMIAIICMGALRDGITTWMPSYITETYHLSSVVSILTGVIMPVFSIFAIQASSTLYRKKFTNPVANAAVLFGAGAVSALALTFLFNTSAATSVGFSAVLTACMHGVNLMLITMLPPYFKKYGNVSTASGVLNACTYIGSAISTYGIAVLSDNFGWQVTLLTWLGIAILGTALCLICIRPWHKTHHAQ